MNEFQRQRIQYLIIQAEKHSIVCLGQGDAELLKYLIEYYYSGNKWWIRNFGKSII